MGSGLPNSATTFLILIGIVIVLSVVYAALGVPAIYDFLGSTSDEILQRAVQAVNPLAPDSIRHTVTTAVPDFTKFFALGTVFTIMIDVDVADGIGFMSALLCKVVTSTSKAFVATVVVFLGTMSNITSSTGYAVLIPLGAILSMAFGRHPIAGLVAAFVGVSEGWSVNLLIGTNNPMSADTSIQAAQMIDPGYAVLPICSWYFMIASTFLITIIGTIVMDKLIELRLTPYMSGISEVVQDIAENKKRGMRWAGITALAHVIFMAVLVVPSNGLLRSPKTHAFPASSLVSEVIFFAMLLFLLPGLAYGIGAGTVRSDKDVVVLMDKTTVGLAGFMVLTFFVAQFTTYSNYSNLGTIIFVSGTDFLQSVGLVELPLTICLTVLTAFINISTAVDSAKWVIMAPTLAPMFMRLGLSPELTQIAYRIGNSSTSIIVSLMPFFVLIVTFFQKYDKKTGTGSVVSTMLPYSLAFLIGWIIIFIVRCPLGPPLGPGSPMFY